jgi:hypothetical protein
VTLTAVKPRYLQRYAFGLRTSEQILCSRCGVYMAMTLSEKNLVWSVINVDALDDRALFTQTAQPRDYGAEDRQGRLDRRKARWCPTTLVGWPPSAPPA